MTLDEILAGLFPDSSHDVARRPDGTLLGQGTLPGGSRVAVIGVVDGSCPGVDEALVLSAHVLDVIAAGGRAPILVLVDSGSQRMSRRDELLGLSQYLSHLAKTLLLAGQNAHPTLGLLYGGSAAGAFIATALATRILVALPGAHPVVMDLPSMAKVTKLPLERLEGMAKATPVFAPGLENLSLTGAIDATLDPSQPLGEQIAELLTQVAGSDRRGALGASRGGRTLAESVAEQVRAAIAVA